MFKETKAVSELVKLRMLFEKETNVFVKVQR